LTDPLPHDRRNLSDRSLSALKWNYVGVVAKILAQLAIGVLLARLLGPEPFGLVAMAWIVIGLGNLVADFGLGAALVQRKEITDLEIRYVFTAQVIFGLILTGIVAVSSGLMAYLFKRADIVPVVQVLSLFFVIQSFGQTATSLLKRDLNFKAISLAQLLTYLFAYFLLGVPLAYAGLGVWSLVVAQLTQSLLYTLAAYFLARHAAKPPFSCPAEGYFSFGFKSVANNLANWSINNVDNAFIGRFFGATELGLYNRAFMLLIGPANHVIATLQGVLFATYSRIQDKLVLLRQIYLASMGGVALIFMPVLAGIAVIPGTLIEGLYGERWLAAVPLVVPLALAIPLNALLALGGPLIAAQGKVERELYMQATVALLMIPVMYITAHYSLSVLAWGVFSVYFVRFIFITFVTLHMVQASWRGLMHVLRGGILLSLWTVPIIWITDQVLTDLSFHPAFRLVLEFIVGCIAWLAGLLLAPKLILVSEIAWFLRRAESHAPNFIKPFLKHIEAKG
jgi:PST family polysaccharide transporter